MLLMKRPPAQRIERGDTEFNPLYLKEFHHKLTHKTPVQ